MPFIFNRKDLNEKNFINKLKEELNSLFVESGAYVVEQSRENAPVVSPKTDTEFEDDLAKSIRGVVFTDSKGMKGVRIESTHPAAAAKHELVETERRESSDFEVLKASKSETGGVGTKYAERAITQSTDKVTKHILDGILAYFSSKKKRNLVIEDKIRDLVEDNGR